MLGIMDSHRTFLASALLLVILGSGCESITDISHDKRYATDYAVGDVYRTRQPLYFWVGALTAKRHYDVTDTLEAGSQVRIAKIEADYGGPEMRRRMVITGCILDGKHGGQQVELWPISRFQVQRHPSCAVYFVDTNFVERVSQ